MIYIAGEIICLETSIMMKFISTKETEEISGTEIRKQHKGSGNSAYVKRIELSLEDRVADLERRVKRLEGYHD